ncbi:MAG: SprB repeat-containing protein, partial [Phaeodactylibacter sp.]|nr:SprB repeat-containing protein [Phaeodactylibacter sp.]
ASDTVTIYVSNPQAQLTQFTDATCPGICNGNATVQASGGFVSGDYQYIWSNGAGNATATDLCGGNYSVTVTDDIGCTGIQDLDIGESAFEVVAVSLVSPCAISTVGEAQAIVDGGTLPYSYSWDNGELTAVATNLSDGTHQVTVMDANGCTAVAEVDISTNPNGFQFLIETDQDSICAGASTILFTTDGPGNTQFEWSTGATDVTAITVAPTTTTTYTLTALTPGENLIINGDFEAGDLGFTSDYALGTGGPWGPLSNAGTYAVASNTNDVHSNFASCTDHTTGSGDMLIVNGSTLANENIWCQVVTVAPNTDYQFSTWIMTAISENPAILQFSINGNLLGDPFEAAFQTCDWLQFFEVWNSGSLTTAEICIVNQNVGQSGNDFALDDISLVPLCTSSSEKSIIVSNLEAQIINPINIGCDGLPGSAEITASLGIEPYFYSWSTGDNTPAAQFLTGGTYLVTVTDQLGCAAVQTVQIEAASINIDNLIIQDLSCGETGSDFIVIIPGMLTIEMGAGMPPFQYSLDNGTNFSTDNTFDNLDPGIYTILVEDEAGCQTTMEASIADLSFPSVTITSSGVFAL